MQAREQNKMTNNGGMHEEKEIVHTKNLTC